MPLPRVNTQHHLDSQRETAAAPHSNSHMQLSNERFDKLITSPLARATETADIIWQEMGGPRSVLPALREIDLYSFQGLLKADGIAKYGREFKTWQQQPAEFEIDGRKPVVELWHRASMAWHDILLDDEVQSCVLVVAHNAVNQALVATATGLGPQFFRRLLQSNAASTVLDFVPRQGGGPPVVTIDRLNQVRFALGQHGAGGVREEPHSEYRMAEGRTRSHSRLHLT